MHGYVTLWGGLSSVSLFGSLGFFSKISDFRMDWDTAFPSQHFVY